MACLEALPTKSGLHIQVPAIEVGCGVCGAIEESGIHGLDRCGLAHSVWEISSLSSFVPDAYNNVGEWYGHCLPKMEREDLKVFLTLYWEIWGGLMSDFNGRRRREVGEYYILCHENCEGNA